MKGLLRKDIYMAAKYYRGILVAVAIFLMLAILDEANLFFLTYAVLISGMLPVSLLSYDAHFKWEQYSGTLPYTRAQLVSAKYLVGLIFNGGVLLVCLLVLALRQILGEGFDLDAFLGAGLLCFVLGVAAPAFLLPLAFKFGPEKGRVLFFVLVGAICGIGFVLGQTGFLTGLSVGNGAVAVLAALGVTLVLYLLSWRLSIHFYQKKEF